MHKFDTKKIRKDEEEDREPKYEKGNRKSNEDRVVRISKRKALERAKSKSDPFKGEEGKTLSRKEEDIKGKTKNM